MQNIYPFSKGILSLYISCHIIKLEVRNGSHFFYRKRVSNFITLQKYCTMLLVYVKYKNIDLLAVLEPSHYNFGKCIHQCLKRCLICQNHIYFNFILAYITPKKLDLLSFADLYYTSR